MIVKYVLLVVFAATAAVYDIRFRRIPNVLILSMLGAWLFVTVYEIIAGIGTAYILLLDCGLGMLAGGGIFFAVYFASRKGLGGGDVKFMAAAGLYLGIAGTLPAILFGSILAALTGLILIVTKRITRKDKVPLVPFLLAGIVITILL